MRKFYGLRYADGSVAIFEEREGSPDLLPMRQDCYNHSPDGGEWSYAGSGPAQLALALLMAVLGDWKRVQPLYQDFKFAFVAKWPARQEYGVGPDGFMSARDSMPALREWEITEEEILAWVKSRTPSRNR